MSLLDFAGGTGTGTIGFSNCSDALCDKGCFPDSLRCLTDVLRDGFISSSSSSDIASTFS